ncbi:S-adenosylmethionine-dependent methyltransferase [Penicillium angulare]|uniref:S-adenosylmethionine-dependent methyltransferase n=1 Tax=Penicillium angulare TaxID=116970 RepID=A0A9W9KNX1_9EURO|nr:S-adenosylmethionine-dependent methyltransferase [Penicillium angulare]
MWRSELYKAAIRQLQHTVYNWQIAKDVIANRSTYLDGTVQPPVSCFGDLVAYLHEHLCALYHARDHGSQPERAVWNILEMRAYWRATESLCQHMLFPDGSKTPLILFVVSGQAKGVNTHLLN